MGEVWIIFGTTRWQNYIHPCKQSLCSTCSILASKIFVEHVACCLLLGYSFERRLSSRAGSVMIICLSIKRCSHLENQFDEREQDWLLQQWGLWWLKTLHVIPREVLQISSDWDDQRIFLGLKFSISGCFGVGKFWQASSWVAWFK